MSKAEDKTADQTKMIIVILLLVFFYPAGVIAMFFMTKWPWWVKSLLTLPLILGLIFAIMLGSAIAVLIKSAPEKGTYTPAPAIEITSPSPATDEPEPVY